MQVEYADLIVSMGVISDVDGDFISALMRPTAEFVPGIENIVEALTSGRHSSREAHGGEILALSTSAELGKAGLGVSTCPPRDRFIPSDLWMRLKASPADSGLADASGFPLAHRWQIRGKEWTAK